MQKQLANFRNGGIVLILIGLMLSACAPAASASSLYASPCHPPTDDGNVYRQPVQSILGAYYSGAFRNPNDTQLYESMQYEAIKLLATQTKRWTDSIEISLGTKYVRMSVTYLSPELIQTIILNHYLFRRNVNLFNDNFEADVLSKMETIANRNEHLFFFTLTSSYYETETSYTDPVIIQLPLQSLVLTNSSNRRVIPAHDDHNLEERIDLTFAPTYGHFAFPIAVNVNGNCEYLLDKANNTHIVISIPFITINDTNYQTRPWMFDYVPPLNLALDPNPIENRLLVQKDSSHFRPSTDLPVSITSVEDEGYWESLGRFIWHAMTLDP